jgi:hypothetical protein
MPNYSSVGRMSARVNQFNRRNNNIIIKNIPKEVLKRIIIIMDSYSSKKSVEFVKFLINNNLVINNIDVYNGSCKETTIGNTKINNLSELLHFFYNKGYRMFISNNNSFDTYQAFNWIKSHNDVIVFNTFSTLASEDFLNNIPKNLIRTSVNDLDMMKYFIGKVVNNFTKNISDTGNDKITLPLSKTKPGEIPFSIIVYIYEPSLYTSGYLNNLQEIIYKSNNENNIEFVSIKLENGLLPDLAKYYLTFNNISNPKYIDSVKKPFIIFNSDNPDSLFKYLDDPKYYDNYTLFSDIFSSKLYNSKYPFTAAFVNICNFSDIGYRLSYLVDKEQTITPQTLNIYNILSQCGSIFMLAISKNKYVFNSYDFITLLNKYLIVSNGDWGEKYVNVYKYISAPLLNSQLFENKFELLSSYHKWNPNAIIVYSSSSTILNYNHIVMENEINTYLQNTQRIEIIKPNIDNLLDNVVEYYLSASNVSIYMDFLESNYKNDLPKHIFTEYYIYKSSLTYNLPIIFPKPIVISKAILKDKYVLPIDETNSSFEITIQIPSIVYDTKVYYYDTITQELINILTDNYLEETYDVINLTLEDTPSSIKLHLYKGNLLNVGTYNEITNTFTTTEKIRGYVSQDIIINWLIIETEYLIGDNIIVKDSLKTGKVTGVSDDKYIITALIDGDVTETTYNQTQISKIFDI